MDGFGKDLGRQCPVLQELYLKRCDVHMDVIASPTLTSLTIIRPRLYGSEAGPLRIIAPRLASMLLKLSYIGWKGAGRVKDGAPDQEPLALLAKASIQLMGLYEYRRDRYCWEAAKLLFIQSMCCFLALLPNVANLHLSGFTVDFEALLKKKSLQFPPLHNLKTLLLEECGVGTTFQILTSILRNTPNLEKLGLHHCIFLAAPPKETRKKEQEASKSRPLFLWCKKLKSIEIKRRQEDEPRMLKVLSEIRHGMLRSWWRKVMISSTIVERIE
ncbi:hypothetical protein QYE76_049203 [Lolium multiflorum]|uniref:Uncharacterized protein n=1 Tax=Lolium multiflorum TaxID=4521 RepID=A0AAD8WG40_LOLMU|nr:hypothetical protein QYE76_049203 [Lolium multiflorum]